MVLGKLFGKAAKSVGLKWIFLQRVHTKVIMDVFRFMQRQMILFALCVHQIASLTKVLYNCIICVYISIYLNEAGSSSVHHINIYLYHF